MAPHYFSRSGGDNTTQRLFTVPHLPLSWPTIPVLVPHRIRRKFRSTRSKIRSMQTPTSSIASLNTSIRPSETIRTLRTHKWSYYDAQYLLLASLWVFTMSIIEDLGPLAKTVATALLLTSLVIPLTRQFFLPFLPAASWLMLWYSCKYISGEYRPPIWVRVLPALENILYGANLSNILSAHKSTVLDVLAWLPYGITHFGAPVVVTGFMFIFGPPGIAPIFAKSFGYMCITGVLIQLVFPCAPPWYENKYGLAPANYSMSGSPAGLAAIDKLFGIDMYTSSFTASPVVFGAFPSLHSGNVTIEALFMSYLFPKLMPLFLLYAGWMWWATMYLSHHYIVDLVAGACISGLFYFAAKTKWIPRVQEGKMFRWDYDYVEYGEAPQTTSQYAYGLAADLDDYQQGGFHGDSDEWTIGSSSSFSSSSRDPSAGMRSPVTDDSWEGETLGSTSDTEYHGKA